MKRILVIEDDASVRMILAELLKDEFDVRTAVDGMSGVYATLDDEPDVILLDLSMPRMGGWDVVETLRGDTRTDRIPIVVMTALDRPDYRQRAEDWGCFGFLGKPFDEEEMFDLLRRATGSPLHDGNGAKSGDFAGDTGT